MSENITTQIADNEEYEEEEIFVYCDFESILPKDEINEGLQNFKVIGIDSENPIIQINQKIYKGTYSFAMGTHVYFDEVESYIDDSDPLYGPTYPILHKCFAKSNKVLQMERIFVQPVHNISENDMENNHTLNEEEERKKYIVDKTYSDALQQLLGRNQVAPRHIDEANMEPSETQIMAEKKQSNENDDTASDITDDPKDEDYVPDEYVRG